MTNEKINTNYFQREIETASRKEIRQIQDNGLVDVVKRVYKNVPYYRNKMLEMGITPDDIHGVKDLYKLPFTTKDDLRKTYPDGLLATDLSDCVRVHSTSGTTGKRVVSYYTENDITMWEKCCARALTASGATKDDVIQISFGYGLFTGGAGFHGGSHRIGALTLPMSSGNTDRQLRFMEDLKTTVLCCTPSYAAYLAEIVDERALADRLKLRIGIFGAEAWSEEMRADIEDKLHIKAFDIYGLTEISGPGVAYQCSDRSGLHINEDNFIAEIIDPETEEPLPVGEKGELVFTSFTKEAFPLIRYRTRDICILSDDPCVCGRTFVKMSKPMGRSDDMLIVKGVNVFPSQIETVLINEGYPAYYQIIITRENNSDKLELQVEMTKEMFSDEMSAMAKNQKHLVSALKSMLGIHVDVKLVTPKSLKRSDGKSKRVIDKRHI